MGKFSGNVIFERTTENDDGAFISDRTILPYKGDVYKDSVSWNGNSNTINDDLRVQHRISIVQDSYISENSTYIKAVEFMGEYWKVSGIEARYPRLILSLGGLYNGSSN